VATVTARRLATTHTARAVNVMGIRGTMWQMMEHGSPVYLVEALQVRVDSMRATRPTSVRPTLRSDANEAMGLMERIARKREKGG
jgi:hypothetical protein